MTDRISVLVALAAVACAGACSSDDVEEPDENKQLLIGDDYTLAPGEEIYMCQTFRSPADRTVAISEVVSTSGFGEHHLALFQTVPEEMDGTFECPNLVRLNWQPIWAGGTGSPSLALPAGVAFKIAPNTQFLVQLHLQNASDAPITDHSQIELSYLPAERAELATPAGIYAVGSFDISIPARTTDYTQTTECVTDRALNVFAAFPHMHKIGTEIELFHGSDQASLESIYRLDPWPFDDQPMDPVDWKIELGDHLRTICHWDNPTDAPVVFGDSSDDEMCFFVMFYYPFDGLAGCIEGI